MGNVTKISVVTPSFNQAGFIERTVQSVLSQDAGVPVEHLVIDGGSTDGTLEILGRYTGKIHWISEPDRGMADALNKGFFMATGDVTGWLNSDDTYLPGTLRKVTEFFDAHPDVDWLYGNCRMVDASDREIRGWITAYKKHSARKYRYDKLLVENFISQPAVFMRTKAFKEAGPVDLTLPTAMDYDLWLRMARNSRPGHITDDLACFRVHGKSISARNYRLQFAEQYRIHKRYDHNPWRLLSHRMRNLVIVGVYSLLRASRGKAGKSRDQ
ncbi:MAG TPA: glycosyltransferase family 2 protein [Bacteroidales bacterium]|nr:glycosyltransferase family 2 protein [Bacteroidales bacterium]